MTMGCGAMIQLITTGNGQAERTNQTVKIALRCWLVGKYEENWALYLPDVEYALNTAENASTSTTPFELLYGVRPSYGLLHPVEKIIT